MNYENSKNHCHMQLEAIDETIKRQQQELFHLGLAIKQNVLKRMDVTKELADLEGDAALSNLNHTLGSLSDMIEFNNIEPDAIPDHSMDTASVGPAKSPDLDEDDLEDDEDPYLPKKPSLAPMKKKGKTW